MKYIFFIFLCACGRGENHQPLTRANAREATAQTNFDYMSIAKIFSNRCIVCHREGGQNPNWASEQDAEKYLSSKENSIKAFWKVTKDPRGGAPMPLEGTPQAQQITAEERRALADYFSSH